MSVTIDVDTGGTFTDGFFTRDGLSATAKVDTTPHDLSEGFSACLAEGASKLGFAAVAEMLRQAEVVRFSTTAGTNALIQGDGPRLGVLVAAGRSEDLYGDAPSPVVGRLVEPEMVAGVDVGDEDGIRNTVEDLLGRGARVLIVSLPGAHLDPAEELAVRAVIRSTYPRHYLGATPVVCSSHVSRRPDDRRRTHAAVLDAYLHPRSVRTLYRADDLVRDQGGHRPLLIANAGGGAARVAKTVAIDTLNSGPACGVVGARGMAELLGLDRVVTLDIGGTSSDIAVVGVDAIPFDDQPEIHGVETNVGQVDVGSIGGGGGSIVSVSDGGVRVGPRSAGSVPGPACYGLGGSECTVTDANVAGGFINPDYFLGGRRRLDLQRAIDAVDRAVVQPLDVDRERAVRMVRGVLADIIADEIEGRCGGEAGSLSLFVFGGGGGLHAADIAERLGIDDVHLFRFGSVFSAYGSSTLDIVHAAERPVAGMGPAALAEELADGLVGDMAVEGFDPDSVSLQYHYLTAGLDDDDAVRTDDLLRSTVSSASEISDDATFLRVVATAPATHPAFRPDEEQGSSTAPKGRRDVLGEPRAIYDMGELGPGSRIEGPALVEAEDTTTDVPAGWSLAVDRYHNARLRRV
jgi:N-methylhydantoinase A